MGLLGAIGGLFGGGADSGDLRKAREYEQSGLDAWTNLPSANLTSAYNNVAADPRYKQAQLNAIDAYGNMATAGVTDADRARLAGAQRQIGAQEAGQRGAIQSNYAARGGGQGGMSGAEYAAQIANQQGAADRAAGMGSDVVAAGGNRALAAYGGMANTASTGRSEDFGEQAARAQANDAINRFNANYNMQRAGGLSGAYGNAAAQRMGHYTNAVQTGQGIGEGVEGLAQKIPVIGSYF